MKSKMSCCNGALLRRALTRTALLWGAYLILWLVGMPANLMSVSEWDTAMQLKQTVLNNAANGSHAGHNPFGRAHTVGRVVVFGNGDVLAARHYLSRCGGCAHAEHSVGVATRCHSLCVGRQNSGRIAFYNYVLSLRSRRSEHSEADQ